MLHVILVFMVLLAMLCGTAQQSYCRHAGIRHPSVWTETQSESNRICMEFFTADI